MALVGNGHPLQRLTAQMMDRLPGIAVQCSRARSRLGTGDWLKCNKQVVATERKEGRKGGRPTNALAFTDAAPMCERGMCGVYWNR